MMNSGKKTFDDDAIHVLLHPEKWRVVCPELPAECEIVKNPAHSKWARDHTDHHQHREVLIALKGGTAGSLNEVLYSCLPGTIFLFDEFAAHDQGYPPQKNDFEHLWIGFAGQKIVARKLNMRAGRIENISNNFIMEESSIYEVANSSWKFLHNTDMPVELRRQKIVAAIFLVVLEIVKQDITGSSHQPEDYHEKIINMIKRHIDNHHGKKLTIDKLARLAGYSKFHFFRLFREHTGMCVHAYITEARIRKVKDMLAKGYSKKQTALEMGFSCPSSFAHWYRKHFS